jgi:hypothetical protein
VVLKLPGKKKAANKENNDETTRFNLLFEQRE